MNLTNDYHELLRSGSVVGPSIDVEGWRAGIRSAARRDRIRVRTLVDLIGRGHAWLPDYDPPDLDLDEVRRRLDAAFDVRGAA